MYYVITTRSWIYWSIRNIRVWTDTSDLFNANVLNLFSSLFDLDLDLHEYHIYGKYGYDNWNS